MPVERNNETRRKETSLYWPMVVAATEFFVEEIAVHPELPMLDLTQQQYNGLVSWKMPKDYEDIALHVIAETVVHHNYELGPSQLVFAFLEAAWQSGRLRIDGKLRKS